MATPAAPPAPPPATNPTDGAGAEGATNDNTDNETSYLDAKLLTPTKQWSVVYRQLFLRFLRTFKRAEETTNNPSLSAWAHYEREAITVARAGATSLFINIADFASWTEGGDLGDFLQRYYLELRSQIDAAVETFIKDVIRRYRQGRQRPRDGSDESAGGAAEGGDAGAEVLDVVSGAGSQERNKYSANFWNARRACNIRSLRCEFLGELIDLNGTVTRTSDIRPELKSASFDCDNCHLLIEGVEQQFKYTEPTVCQTKGCGNRTSWSLRHDSCEFADWQKLRLQENASEIPAGSMPRCLDVIVNNDNCERCKPGDRVVLSGCLAAVPDVSSLMKPGDVPRSVMRDRSRGDLNYSDNAVRGLRKLGVRDLAYRLVFFASNVRVVNMSNAGTGGVFEAEELGRTDFSSDPVQVMNKLGIEPTIQETFLSVANSQATLDTLAKSIAPEVFGCDYIKKGLLLMLVGGVEKSTHKDGIKLRGDLNICIVGDPGTAKSQLLKFIQSFAGRAVYTSGKSCTAAGLTASVHRDPDQGDAVIEAGALMLADRGICCIDEFEKMDEKDMVAIHEAMEQQTISIAKAGIQATLNARASVLAACNPRNGRYDTSRTFRQNVRLSAPIMSRFDLLFTLLDDTDRDELVARHMLMLHADPTRTMDDTASLSREQLQNYLRVARMMRPRITDEAKTALVKSYVALRQDDTAPGSSRSVRITVRQLESLIRLSEATAKLKFSPEVQLVHVQEARRIFLNSLTKVQRAEILLEDADDEAGGDATDGEGQGTAKKNELRIDAGEFERIASILIESLRNEELALQMRTSEMATDGTQAPFVEAVVKRSDLINWYLETYESGIESEEDLAAEHRKVQAVINRMVNRDFTLIEETREFEVATEDGVEIQHAVALRLHPNYADPTSDNLRADRAGRHATLPTSYFSGAESDGAGAVAEQKWHTALDDNEFVEYMYSWNDTE